MTCKLPACNIHGCHTKTCMSKNHLLQSWHLKHYSSFRRVFWGGSLDCSDCTILYAICRKDYMMRSTQKGPLCNMWTMQALISLRICAGWSGPALSTYRINRYCSICRRTENVQIRLHRCTCSSGSSLFAHGIRSFFPRCASYEILFWFTLCFCEP